MEERRSIPGSRRPPEPKHPAKGVSLALNAAEAHGYQPRAHSGAGDANDVDLQPGRGAKDALAVSRRMHGTS